MKILYLGPKREKFAAFLLSFDDEVVHVDSAMTERDELLESADFIVSYGYRYLLPKAVTFKFARRAINLHISLLPWNRGADPNLWSFLENSPKGVTIHYIDEGIDTGDILAQKYVDYVLTDTLRTSYQRLENEIEQLFFENWPQIRAGRTNAVPQPQGGSFHRLRDSSVVEHLLTHGWDTPVVNLVGKALAK